MSRVVETSKFWLVFIIDRINPGTGRIGYAKAFNIDMAVDKILKIILDTVREKKNVSSKFLSVVACPDALDSRRQLVSFQNKRHQACWRYTWAQKVFNWIGCGRQVAHRCSCSGDSLI